MMTMFGWDGGLTAADNGTWATLGEVANRPIKVAEESVAEKRFMFDAGLCVMKWAAVTVNDAHRRRVQITGV